jgi:septal ring factor EnvC (AmiA/AmiB activator)
MTANISGPWTVAIIAFVVAAIALAFGVYQAQKGVQPSQREQLSTLSSKLADQDVLIAALQRQSAEQWTRMMAQERQIADLSVENKAQRSRIAEQDALISALQRQLGGLAHGNARTGRRLRDVLTKKLNAEELKQWAFDLDIPFDSLSGESLPALVVSMLDYLERYGKLEEALSELRRRRPDIPLEDVSA